MCCAEFIVKYILFFANVAFCLAGAALIGLGIAVLYNVSELLELVPGAINAIPITLIVVGCVIFVIAFFGCCGAIREGRCLLVTYAVCMIILAAIKIYIAVVIFRNLDAIHNDVEEWLTRAFNSNNREPFHLVEISFRCCGTTGPNAYVGALPPSCCSEPTNNTCDVNSDDLYTVGCNELVGNYFESFGTAIGTVIIIIIGVELVAMIFALFLNHAISNKNRR